MNFSELQKFSNQINEIALRYNADNIRVFGSIARGEANPNDVDILVHFKDNATLFDESGLSYELNKLLGCKVDLLADDSIREEIQENVLKDSVPLL